MEASGIKATLNGVLHMSVLEGGGIEGYNGKNGWAFGDSPPGQNQDRGDAEQLYDLLEREVIPMYYTLSDDAIPHMWVKKMKEKIRSTAPQFSAKRMLKEYVRRGYDPALTSAAKYMKTDFL